MSGELAAGRMGVAGPRRRWEAASRAGDVWPGNRRQWLVAFSAPRPVSERTSISAYFAPLYSLLRIVPR